MIKMPQQPKYSKKGYLQSDLNRQVAAIIKQADGDQVQTRDLDHLVAAIRYNEMSSWDRENIADLACNLANASPNLSPLSALVVVHKISSLVHGAASCTPG